jgi:exopolysaccharide biosynthesis polyprenyl glycosylphosphotransferase
LATQKKYDYRLLFRRYILIFVDVLLVVAALLVYLRFFHPTALQSYHTFSDNLLWMAVIILLWFMYSYIFNLYKLSNVDRITTTIRNTIFTAVLTGSTYLFIPFLSPTLPISRTPAFVLIAVMVILVLIWRLCYAAFFIHPILNKKALVVGAGYTGREIVRTLLHDASIYHKTAYKIYGYIDDDVSKLGKIYDDLKVLGNGSMLLKFAKRLDVDEIIMAIPDKETLSADLFSNLIDCENAGLQVIPATQIYEEQTGRVMIKIKENEFHLTNPYSIVHKDNFYTFTNRIINISCALIAGMFFLLVLPFVWLGNLFFSKGPLFFLQERIGENNKKFKIIKFRTMIVDAEKESGPQFAQKNDNRITKVGNVLRKTRFDELPQFWNVLRGDINLIGPRPEREYFVDELSKKIPFFKLRNTVKPGLTGWAQVKHHYASDFDDTLVKLQYDLYYIKHRSLLLDLLIIFKTIAVMIKFKGT